MRVRTSEWLDAAADLLERKGWARGGNHPTGKRCVTEALESTSPEWVADTRAPVAYIARQIDPTISNYALGKSHGWAVVECIEGWNNFDVDSAAEVIDTLRWAAKAAREDERENE